MWNRGFGRLSRAAWTACGLCGHTRMEHHLGYAGTRRHEFITKKGLKEFGEAERDVLLRKYAEDEQKVLRCPHGNPIKDEAGKALEVACGCKYEKL